MSRNEGELSQLGARTVGPLIARKEKSLTGQSLELIRRLIIVVEPIDAQRSRTVAHVEVVGRERSETWLIADHGRIFLSSLLSVGGR